MDKIKLIKEITKRHPAYGVEIGWSEYTGGMKDTGYWFWEVMLEATDKELQDFLDKIIVEENTPTQEVVQSPMAEIEMNGNKYYMRKAEIEAMEKLNLKMQRALLGPLPSLKK